MNQPTLQHPKVTDIRASITNPRKRFDELYLTELAASIKTLGVLQPILCRPITFVEGGVTISFLEIVAGECRWRASKIAAIETIPVLVRVMTDLEALEIQVIENLQRKDLHPIEEAEGYQQLMEKHGFTAEQLAAKVSKSKAYIYARLKLSALEASARTLFFDGNLTPSAALLIARIPVPVLQAKAAKEIANGFRGEPMTQRDVINHLDRHYMLLLKDAPFKADDEKLLLKVGPCTKCPKRTGNQSVLFSDVKSADVCTDPLCFDAKRNAWSVIQIKRAKEAGQTVIEGAEAKKVFPHQYSPDHPADGFKKLDAVCYDDPKNRTYGQLAKAANVATVVAKNPHSGSAVELIKLSDLKPALNEIVGVKAINPHSEDAKKAKAETAFRLEVFGEVLKNAAANGWTDADWHGIAKRMLHGLESNDRRFLITVLDWDKSLGTWDGKKQLSEKVESLTMQDLSGVLLAASLINDVRAATYSSAKPEALFDSADRHGVDVEKIMARRKAEEKAKADAKKKPAVKKATGKAVPAPSPCDVKQDKAKKAKALPKAGKAVAGDTAAPPAAEAWPFPTAKEIAAKKEPKEAASEAPADEFAATSWPFPTGARP